MDYRIGFGFDVHQLKEGNDFKLGGLNIPHHKGSVGHSDADVLIHAICDAILGATNLGDIGTHFPDDSAKYKGIDSRILLKKVMGLLLDNGYTLANLDSTICLEKPKIATFISKMKITLAECMDVEIDKLSIKATTNEKLGYLGREEGIAAYATVLIFKSNN